MAVNLISSNDISVTQTGSDITLDVASNIKDMSVYTSLNSGTDATYGISYTASARGKTITITLSVNTLLAQINTGALNYTLFTLPSGYRPSAELSKMVSSNYGHRFKLVIATNGDVKIGYVYSALNSNQYDQLAELITFVI